MIQPLWRIVWRFLKTLNTKLPYDPTIPLLDVYLKKTIIQKDTCTPKFIAAVLTVFRTWKQPKWPSSKSLQTINAGQGVEKREHSCTVGGNVN